MRTHLALIISMLAALPPAASAQESDHAALIDAASSRALRITIDIWSQACKQGQGKERFPTDLASAVLDDEAGDQSAAQRIRERFILPGQEKSVPDDADVSWVNEHSPFVYAIPANLLASKVPAWDRIMVVHLRPDHAIRVPPSEANPEGEIIVGGFLKGFGMPMTRREFEQRRKTSQQILDAAQNNTPFPGPVQIEADGDLIRDAIRAYAAAHADHLPPDLGSLLDFLPPDEDRRPTPRDRARVFLSPRAAANTFIPEEPDRDWINRNTSYVYLANESVRFGEIDDVRTVLFHLKLNESYDALLGPEHTDVVYLQTARNTGELGSRDYVEARARECRELFDCIKERRELPDRYHALRDLRYIRDAINAYRKEHDKQLPADLADTLAYLPDDDFSRIPGNKAAIYLSPRAQRSRGALPESIDAEWVRGNSTYVYLGIGGITVGELSRRGGNSALVHGPYSETIQDRGPYMTSEHVPVLAPHGMLWLCSPQVIDRQKEEMARPRDDHPK